MHYKTRSTQGGTNSLNDQPKVSIITVCFNSAKTIRDTIESVINQTYDNIEYIIIDGGSTDGTLDIIREYEPYIAKWVSEPDNGIYDAMNKGIKMATGDIIGIINSDDWYALDCISSIVHTFITDPKIDVVHGNIVICDEDGIMLYHIKSEVDIKKDLYKRMTVFHPTMFTKKAIYETEGLYHDKYLIAADYDLLFRVVRENYRIKNLDKELAFMRLGGISNSNHYQLAKEYFHIRSENAINIFKNSVITLRGILGPSARKVLDRIGLTCLTVCYRKHRYRNIRYYV
jgi:glycosyltransferase involved in cell wall biosynthesis